MRADTRSKIEKALFKIESYKISEPVLCGCRRPLPKVLPPAVEDAIDEIRAALADEPDSGIGGYIEIGDTGTK